MTRFIVFCLIPIFYLGSFQGNQDLNYLNYHEQIIDAEKSIVQEEFANALAEYEQIFKQYDFVFLRDYKVACQLAFYLGDRTKGFDLLEKAIAGGWELQELKKNTFLKPFHKDPRWTAMESSYDDLRRQYAKRIDWELRDRLHLLFKEDQKKAMGALVRIGNKSKERYGTKVFAPHSEKQMNELKDIMDNDGYPGEKIIGNDYWVSTIISHHNSISKEYAQQDTIYAFIKPKLFEAVENGEMSPYEYALIDDWQKAVVSERTEPGYGFLSSPKRSSLSETDQLRQKIGLRPIDLRNKLVETERKTGMDFYLPDWISGTIHVE